MPRPSGTSTMPVAHELVRRPSSASAAPSKRTSPPAAGTRPVMARSVVVLPAPLAPMSVTISPCPSVSETPFSAWIAP